MNPYITLMRAFSYLQKQAQDKLGGNPWATDSGAVAVLLDAMRAVTADHDRAKKEWESETQPKG